MVLSLLLAAIPARIQSRRRLLMINLAVLAAIIALVAWNVIIGRGSPFEVLTLQIAHRVTAALICLYALLFGISVKTVLAKQP